VARGGGSIEDLWPFNEEIVARAIYNSRIPVVSAVGHEVDFTISDFVADVRAPTPSAAAELVIPEKEKLAAAVESGYVRLTNALLRKLNVLRRQVEGFKDSYVLREPLNLVVQMRQRLDDLSHALALGAGHILEINRETFKSLTGRLEALSPLAVLSRGYSITFMAADGSVVKDAKTLKAGDRIETRLHKGRVTSVVENINE